MGPVDFPGKPKQTNPTKFLTSKTLEQETVSTADEGLKLS